MNEIRIGLIGGGWMGKAHTTAFHNAKMIFGDDMPVFEIVSDVTEDAAKAFAEQMGYARYTADWHDVVSDPAVDLVDVATPNCMHYEMAKAALEHGKHVFCEKPLSLSAQQSSELAQLAKEKGVVNYCGFSNIMNPANQYVAELVKSGRLGKIMRVHATYDQDMLLDPKIPLAWRHINKLAGSGALGDLCSHLLSVSQMILGDMEAVTAVQSIVIPERPVKAGSSEMGTVENDDVISFLVKYKNGAIGDFSSSVWQPDARIISIMRFKARKARLSTTWSACARYRYISSRMQMLTADAIAVSARYCSIRNTRALNGSSRLAALPLHLTI